MLRVPPEEPGGAWLCSLRHLRLHETEENTGVGEEGLLLQHHRWGWGVGWLVLAQQLLEGAQLLQNLWAGRCLSLL